MRARETDKKVRRVSQTESILCTNLLCVRMHERLIRSLYGQTFQNFIYTEALTKPYSRINDSFLFTYVYMQSTDIRTHTNASHIVCRGICPQCEPIYWTHTHNTSNLASQLAYGIHSNIVSNTIQSRQSIDENQNRIGFINGMCVCVYRIRTRTRTPTQTHSHH